MRKIRVLIQIKARIDLVAILMRMHRVYPMTLLACAIVLAACDRSSSTSGCAGQTHYEVRGLVRGMPPDGKTIEIEHEDIRGFMPSMTMHFVVRDPKDLEGLQAGDAVSFRLNIGNDDSFIDQIKKIARDEVHLPAIAATPAQPSTPDRAPRLREGDMMPVFRLIDQDGRKISLETFRGRPFILTFIFTRCPVPNFCPRMSKNFADLQEAIKSGTGPIAQTKLLSISFDPEFDSPQVLKAYAEHVQAGGKVWTLATGEKSEINDLTHAFSVYVQAEGGTISHGLATALVGSDGIIRKIWRGNEWKPAEVIKELSADPNQAAPGMSAPPG